MTFRYLTTLVFSQLILIGISHAQTADVTEGCAPLSVNFSPPDGANSYFWFLDGVKFSEEEFPAYIFTNAGITVVEFREIENGDVIGQLNIKVYNTPEIDIIPSSASGCIPHSVDFTSSISIDPEISISGYSWIFGDGIGSTETEPSYIYSSSGTFTPSLSIETNIPSCDVLKIFPDLIEVKDPPVTSFITSPDPPVSCTVPLEVSFLNTSTDELEITSYNWDLGISTSTEQHPPAQNYEEQGSYTVVLEATNSAGCSSTASKTVVVGEQIPELDIPSTICKDVPIPIENTIAQRIDLTFDPEIQLFNTVNGVYEWRSSVNNIISQDVFFRNPGETKIGITAYYDHCTTSNEMIVNVEEILIEPIIETSTSCHNPVTVEYSASTDAENPSFKWTFYDSEVSTLDQASKEYYDDNADFYYGEKEITNYETELLVTSGTSGCYDTAIIDFVHAPLNAKILIGKDSPGGCLPKTFEFIDSTTFSTENPIVNWSWKFGDDGDTWEDIPVGSDRKVSHTYTQAGTYEVFLAVENSTGCRDTSYHVTTYVGADISHSLDFIERDNTSSVCVGDTIYFRILNPPSDIEAFHFYTESNRSSHQPFPVADVPWVFNHETGPQDVTLMVERNGCQSQITKEGFITVNGAAAAIGYTHDCADPMTFEFESNSSGASNLIWDFGDNNTSPSESINHTYSDEGNYTIYLTAADAVSGCAATKDSIKVTAVQPVANLIIDGAVCSGQELLLKADGSSGAKCRGYTYNFPTFEHRPITWDQDTFLITLPEKLPEEIGITNVETIELIITDVNGCQDTASVEIEPKAIIVDGSVDVSEACIGQEVSFTDETLSDEPIVSWKWSISNEDTLYTQNPVVQLSKEPANGQTFYVNLEIEDASGCVSSQPDTLLQFDLYQTLPNVFINNTKLCANDSIVFTTVDINENDLSYQWNFGNGNTSNRIVPENIHYADAGTYNVRLDIVETNTGCRDSLLWDIEVQDYPVSKFSTSVDDLTAYCSPIEIEFSDESESVSEISTLSWDFGNDQTSNNSDFTLAYTRGSYNVTLITQTSFGCRDTVSRVFDVIGPVADIVSDKEQSCPGAPINFELANAEEVTSFTWNFGDGNQIENETNVSHTYGFSGPKVVTLELQSDECTSTPQITVDVLDVVAGFRRNDGIDTVLCANSEYPFFSTAQNAQTFSWEFGDGETSSDENPSHIYQHAGTYLVNQYIENPDLGCQDEIEKFIIVTTPPSPEFSINKDSLCIGDELNLAIIDPNPNNEYIWSSDGSLETNDNYDLNFIPESSMNIFLTETDENECSTTIDTLISVLNPTATFSMSRNKTCEGGEILFQLDPDPIDVVNYQWDFGDGSIEENTSPINHIFSAIPENMELNVSLLLSAKECSNQLDTTIYFEEFSGGFVINDGLDTTFCIQNNSVLVADHAINVESYSWDFGDGSSLYEDNNPTHTYSESGTYTVTQIVENASLGCQDIVTKELVITSPPQTELVLSADTICLGETVFISTQNPNEGNTYQWSTEVSGSGSTAEATPETTTTIELTEIDEEGCTSFTSKEVVVITPYEFEDWETTIDLGESVDLPVIYDPNYTFLYDPEEGLSCIECSNPTITPEENIIYFLTVFDNFGCFEETFKLDITVIPPPFISMPDAFTPNGDGINDEVFVGGFMIQELLEFKIFNRWGHLLFDTDKLYQGWDGMLNGKYQNSDIYTYKVIALTERGEVIKKEGYLNLIR